MKPTKIMTVIASGGLLFGAVMSLVNATNGHGIATNETLHEFVTAQLNGDSPQDLTGDPGTGGGGSTPEEEKHFYKKAARLRDIGTTYVVQTGADSYIRVGDKYHPVPPYSTITVVIEGYECHDCANAWAYCDTRLAKTQTYIIIGTGTEEPPTPPAP